MADSFSLIQRELKDIDVYRDTPIRFLGYANEVGESFRAVVPVSLVRLSYLISIGYVCADTFDKSHKVYKKTFDTPCLRREKVLQTAGDTLLWQGLASVAIPGFTINRLCALTSAVLTRTTRMSSPLVKASTIAVGLGAIPFIVHPIDTLVEVGMDRYVRPLYNFRGPAVELEETKKE